MQVFIKKLDRSVDVPEWADLSVATQAYLIDYAWKQSLGDAAASAKSVRDAESLIMKRLHNLKNGVLRAAREGDPIAKEARRIAFAMVQAAPQFQAWAKDNGHKATDKPFQEELRQLGLKLAAREDIVARAKANLEAIDELEVDIDL